MPDTLQMLHQLIMLRFAEQSVVLGDFTEALIENLIPNLVFPNVGFLTEGFCGPVESLSRPNLAPGPQCDCSSAGDLSGNML